MYSRQLLLSLMASLLLVSDLKLAYAGTTVAPAIGLITATEADPGGNNAETTAAPADAAAASTAAAGGADAGTEAPLVGVAIDTTAGSDMAAAATAAAPAPADSATSAPASDVTVGGQVEVVSKGEVSAAATEGATGQGEAVTQAAGGATVGADGTTAGAQVATQGGAVISVETAAPVAKDVTTEKTQEEVVTTAAAAVVPPVADATRPPPEATYKVTSIPVNPYLMVGGKDEGYTGYVIDVLDKLKEIMNVEFELQIVADGMYGKKDGDAWTGMIGEVVDGKADLAAAPLTVTVEREDVVDFTHPFISYSAAAVFMKKPRHGYQSTDTLEDLINQGYKFAVTEGSNIYKVLQTSKNPLYKKILESIDSQDGLKDNNNAGVKQARSDDKYAFLMESTSADWISHQAPCDLMVLKTEIYKRKYAFAVKNLSTLRDKFNRAIIDLQDQGTLEELQEKWFRPKEDCSGCGVLSSSFINVMVMTSLSVFYFFWA